MRAILQTTVVFEVDTEEEAATLAISIDEATFMAAQSQLEKAGIPWEDTEGLIEFFGTQVLMPRKYPV